MSENKTEVIPAGEPATDLELLKHTIDSAILGAADAAKSGAIEETKRHSLGLKHLRFMAIASYIGSAVLMFGGFLMVSEYSPEHIADYFKVMLGFAAGWGFKASMPTSNK